MASKSDRLMKIQTVLAAKKRAEEARLKAKLNEVHSARRTARDLRVASAAQPLVHTAAEMALQSHAQLNDERYARQLETEAVAALAEAQEMRKDLAVTLGREQAAELLAKDARRTEYAVKERRAESVPGRGRRYDASSDDGKSGASSVGTE